MNIHVLEPSRYNELPIKVGPGAVVVVREDPDGIKGLWSACPVIHIDPAWISPEVRDGGLTGCLMLRDLLTIVAASGTEEFYGFTETPETASYAARLGLQEMPYKVWKGTHPFLVKGK